MALDIESIHIWRSAEGEHHFEWQASHPETQVEITPEHRGPHQVTYHPDSPQGVRARVQGLPRDRRHGFQVRDQHGNADLVFERKLGLEGTPNFRDFGGYRTTSGERVQWGFLYRSGQLSNLTDTDLALLDNLQLDLVCDFRREEEQYEAPNRLPTQHRPRLASVPIVPGSNANFFEEAQRNGGGRQAMFDFMVDINRDFALVQNAAYRSMFEEILAVDDARFLVHCAAGKDRTGYAAAIILLALGVPEAIVMRDYLLSQQFFVPEDEIDYLREKYAMQSAADEMIMPVLEVHEDYLTMALNTINQEYSSFETYLEEALGVGEKELTELRTRYLVRA
ncbi:MAG: tyrosine-protein phosphatase [Halioglobus sp.]